MKAATIFMRTAMSIVTEAQKDQVRTFGTIKVVVADAREKLDDSWTRQTFLATDMTDVKTSAGKFFALAKRLDEVAQNLSDSYEVSVDADRSKDQQRKDTFRGLLQESLVAYAEIVLALDETSALLAAEWKIKPDVEKPMAAVSLPGVPVARTEKRHVESLAAEGSSKEKSQARLEYPEDAVAFGGHHYKVFWERLSWNEAKLVCAQKGGYLACIDNAKERAFLADLKGKGKAVWVGVQRVANEWHWIKGGLFRPEKLKNHDLPAGVDYVALFGGSNFDARPLDGHIELCHIKDIAGFICEWDQ